MASAVRTHLAFLHDSKLLNFPTVVTSIRPFAALEEANRQLFKQATPADQVVVTAQTIFHPQGGGSPLIADGSAVFSVTSVRIDAVRDGQVLHLGRFGATGGGGCVGGEGAFVAGDAVEQAVDADARLLYSRLHTAGHVLGAAVRWLVGDEVEGFDELKASHFPESAACEFRGLIHGQWKESIQRKVDEWVAAGLPVEIEWWGEEDFRQRGLERLIPSRGLVAPGEKFRMVNIVGADVYPCGGTHVERTDLCKQTTVKKISRSKGQSRVSYTVS